MTCEYITLADLLSRGWNMAIIKKMRLDHVHVVKGTKMYSLAVVQEMEHTNYCKSLLNKSNESTKIQNTKSDNVKLRKIIQYVKFVKLHINYMPEAQVTTLAVDAYNKLHNTNVTVDSDENFLERIRKNYIRHCLTNYENVLEILNGEFGKNEVYPILKEILIRRIDDAWRAKQIEGCGMKRNIGDVNCNIYDFKETFKLDK